MSVVKSVRTRTAVALTALAMTLSLGVVAIQAATAPEAAAHGSVTDPPSRNYGCWDRWGGDFQNPGMATADPMCYQAWQANTNAMWNWNGLYREGLAGNYQAGIPSGTLCSGGRAENGRYNALDNPGAWVAKGVPNNFRLTLTDGANHGADFLRIYVSKAGFDPTRQALGWENLDLVKETGRYPTTSPYVTDVSLPGRSGRAVLYTVWKASHADQVYFLCSDINIGGGNLGPWPGSGTPSPSVPPTTPPPVSPPPVSPPPVSPPPTGGACTATVRVVNSWSGGYQAELVVKAGTTAITGWSANLTGATITQAWSATLSGTTLTNATWNGTLSAGASTTAGFIGSGTPPTTATCATR
ncbi:lytic polysaccharide monooxygenase auxiliary activity family 9 protein [Antribacter gilvus]|uniref:lytic polysaccharide monooxygenase auxiliary activity family 9 protein n=1 Tax=Antribacter gilvus TaxID=2304675 RepID=UPI000F77D7CD|nr:lytic polysaccharide monooxygenase [Antribacter gilvus]